MLPRATGAARVNLVLNPRKGVAAVLLALPLWLGWSCAAPPPPLLGVLKPISFVGGVICDPFSLTVHPMQHAGWGLCTRHILHYIHVQSCPGAQEPVQLRTHEGQLSARLGPYGAPHHSSEQSW